MTRNDDLRRELRELLDSISEMETLAVLGTQYNIFSESEAIEACHTSPECFAKTRADLLNAIYIAYELKTGTPHRNGMTRPCSGDQ